MPVQSSTQNDLFNLDLIRSYVDKEQNPRFVERDWLKKQVEGKLAEADCRFVLLTAEPGAGKSAFMAWMANQHPDWCRYFIRRDQRTPLGDVGSYSFLLQVGFQLAATYPDLFKQEQIRIVVEQRIGTATNSEIVGAKIGKMFASPFYEKVIQIQQQVTHNKDTIVTGVRIGEFYATERDLPIENLQFMALFDPARAAMLKQVKQATNHPQSQIVVLVDALDELRYQDSELSLLKWLTNCPELPTNLRFVLTCRPDDDLLRVFRGSQQGRIQEISIAEEDSDVEKDLTLYTRFLTETPEVNQTLIEMHQDSDAFTHQAVTKANGNFGYLGAIGRAVDEAIRQKQPDLLKTALDLSQLPNDLQDLYAYFLAKIKSTVDEQAIKVTNPQTGKKYLLEVWSEIYQPILGILSVAREPLTIEQIQKFGDIPGDWQHFIAAIDRLRQFLDKIENRYRLYHSTLPEFFTTPETQANYDYCYVDSVVQNRCIVSNYQAGKKSWAQVDLREIAEDDYGRKHLAHHLVEADRVEELHTLLSLEKDKKNAWFKVKDLKGDTAGFLSDLELAWKQAKKVHDLGLHCRYALIQASINSLAGIPKELLIALVKSPNPYWSAAKALAYARQNPNPLDRFESLALLADQFPDSEPLKSQIFQSALESAQLIKDEIQCAEALTALANKLPDVLPKALEAALVIEDERDRAKALTALADKLPDALPRALEAALAIRDKFYRANALAALVDKLPDTLPKALKATKSFWCLCDFWNNSKRAKVLMTLVNKLPPDKFPPDLLPQALKAALAIWDKYYRAKALIELADKLPDTLPKALETSQAIMNQHERVEVLTVLANKLPLVLLPQALEAALAIEDASSRVKVLMALADKLPEALPKALEAALVIEDERDRALALTALADKLPDMLPKALEAAIIIEDERDRALALTALADKLPTDLLPQALEAALAIRNKSSHTKALTALADKLPTDLLPKALESAQAIKDTYQHARALTALANKLPDVLPKALEAAIVIEDECDRAKALTALVEKLPADLLSKALKAAIAIEDENYRTKALMVLPKSLVFRFLMTSFGEDSKRALVVLPGILLKLCGNTIICGFIMVGLLMQLLAALNTIYESSRAKVITALADKIPNALPKALEVALAIEDASSRAKALTALADKIPDILPKALEAALAIGDASSRAKVITALADKLPEALEAALVIEDASSRVKVLMALADKLPEALPKALEAAIVIEVERDRANALTALVEKLPADLLPKALKSAIAIEDASSRADALTILADKLPEALPKALEAAIVIEVERDRANALTALVEKLPANLLPKALKSAIAIEDASSRAKALTVLADKLPEALPKALEAALDIRDAASRVKARSVLIDNLLEVEVFRNILKTVDAVQSFWDESKHVKALKSLTNKLFPDLLLKAPKDTLAIQNERDRAQILMVLANKLPPDLLSKAVFHFLDYRTRPDLLNDLTTLTPTIAAFGEEAMVEAAQAIQDVSRWWP